MAETVVRILDITADPICMSAEDGEKVYLVIRRIFDANRQDLVSLSFAGLEMITSAFLNAAVGQLYRDYPEELIKQRISAREIGNDDADLLKRVTETAKRYYKDPARLESTIRDILGD
jgi:DNA repair photolyase